MASLVADYGSDEDSDPISDDCDQPGQSNSDTGVSSVQSEEKAEGSGKNFLIQDDAETDSEEESSSEPDEDQTKEKLPSPQVSKLKTPGIGKKKKKVKPKTITKSNAVGSVWLNPYENAEMKKQSVLEKHVKMTEVQITTGKKGRVCKKFKLTGQCRFGKGCKFSHDIQTISSSSQQHQQEKAGSAGPHDLALDRRSKFPELPPPPTQQGFRGTINTLQSSSNPRRGAHQQRMFRQQERFIKNEEDEDDDKFLGDKKRKRVGVSQSLVPPKRALMSLSKQRAEERPWTID